MVESVKAQFVASLKETEELSTALTHIENIVIKHLTDKSGDSVLQKAFEITLEVAKECSSEIVAGVQGISSIPAEWKLASKEDWASFIVGEVVEQGKIISGIWSK